jgi:ferredoxin--NADP+ reductase
MYDIEVISITEVSDFMLKFVTTRPATFRFNSGEFAMIGIDGVFRAYSMVNTKYDDYLEFLSVRKQGEFTNKLELIKPGDIMQLKPKATGSLLPDYLYPKKNLVLLATGTGIAPFMSIARDPDTYARFENVYLFHSVRYAAELAYINDLNILSQQLPFHYIETVTQENWSRTGRFWNYIQEYLDDSFSKTEHAVLICGSPQLNIDSRKMFNGMGWEEGNTGQLGDFLVERAFVE